MVQREQQAQYDGSQSDTEDAPRQCADDQRHGGYGSDVAINGQTVDAIGGNALRGHLLFTTISGRLPRRSDEVTLGASTMRQVDADVGLRVRRDRSEPGRWKSEVLISGRGNVCLSTGFWGGRPRDWGIFSTEGLLATQCGPGRSHRSCVASASGNSNGVLLVKAAHTSAGDGARGTRQRTPQARRVPMAPDNLVNFGQAVNFPLILSVVIILFGVAALLMSSWSACLDAAARREFSKRSDRSARSLSRLSGSPDDRGHWGRGGGTSRGSDREAGLEDFRHGSGGGSFACRSGVVLGNCGGWHVGGGRCARYLAGHAGGALALDESGAGRVGLHFITVAR